MNQIIFLVDEPGIKAFNRITKLTKQYKLGWIGLIQFGLYDEGTVLMPHQGKENYVNYIPAFKRLIGNRNVICAGLCFHRRKFIDEFPGIKIITVGSKTKGTNSLVKAMYGRAYCQCADVDSMVKIVLGMI